MILITGATGHLGNVLVKKLYTLGEKDIRVMVLPNEAFYPLSNMKLDIVCGDIRNKDDVKRAMTGCKYVYHLAGMVDINPKHPEALTEVNVLGTKNVVECCIEAKIKKMVYVSSVHALKEPPSPIEVIETKAFDENNFSDPYAKSKARATKIFYKGIEKGLNGVVVFPSGIIGPFDYQSSQMGNVIKMIINKQYKHFRFCFDGEYDFVDVRDVASSLILAMKKGKIGEGYILSGHKISIGELFKLVQNETGENAKLCYAPMSLVKSAAHVSGFFTKLANKKTIFTPLSIKVLTSNANISNKKAKLEFKHDPREIEQSIKDYIRWIKNPKVMMEL